MTYEIQVQIDRSWSVREWTSEADVLGVGCVESDNRWETEEEALAAIAALVAVGFDRRDLRVRDVETGRVSGEYFGPFAPRELAR